MISTAQHSNATDYQLLPEARNCIALTPHDMELDGQNEHEEFFSSVSSQDITDLDFILMDVSDDNNYAQSLDSEDSNIEFSLPEDVAGHFIKTLFAGGRRCCKDEDGCGGDKKAIGIGNDGDLLNLVEDSNTPDDERLFCLILQLGVDRVKDLPHLQIQDNELEQCF